jgi:hypothetical protein
MKNDDLDQLIARAEENCTNAVQGNPQSCEFGFYSYGDAPGGIGGGTGCFVWFENRDAMLDFIEHTVPYSPPGRSDKDWTEVARQTSAVIAEMRSNKFDDKSGIERLNAALKTFSQIEWIGTSDELMNSNEGYPKEVRAAFGGGNSGPVSAQEAGSFKAFLTDWGI